MKPYSERSQCPKCGKYGASSRYESYFGVEQIVRTCPRCGYKWSEATLDSNTEKD